MVIFWGAGTLVLSLITIIALAYWDRLPKKHLQYIIGGIIACGVLYISSCIAQYGPTFHGQAGSSIPIGVLIMLMFAGFLFMYQNLLFPEDSEKTNEE